MTPSPDPRDLAFLNEILAEFENDPDMRESLMRERIEAARTYLTLSMPSEYQLELKLAEGVLDEVPDTAMRNRIAEFLRGQRGHP
jgi:hypothetical protein